MRNKHGAAVGGGNHALVLETKRLPPFGRNFKSAGGNLPRQRFESRDAVMRCSAVSAPRDCVQRMMRQMLHYLTERFDGIGVRHTGEAGSSPASPSSQSR